jgi:hypothetical protein
MFSVSSHVPFFGFADSALVADDDDPPGSPDASCQLPFAYTTVM